MVHSYMVSPYINKLQDTLTLSLLWETLINASLIQIEILAQQMDNLQKQMTSMQTVDDKKSYTMEDLCPYPFDRSLYMPPFPLHFENPRFDKYRGKCDL